MEEIKKDKWIWDVTKQNCFKAKDIESFFIISENEEFWVRGDLKDGHIYMLRAFNDHQQAIDYVNKFIEENL